MRRHSMSLSLVLALVVLFSVAASGYAQAGDVAVPAGQPTFDVSSYGRLLSDAEVDEIDGTWWMVAVGGIIGAVSHVVSEGVEPSSVEWWTELGVSILIGMIPGLPF